MKKLLAMLLVLATLAIFAACTETTTAPKATATPAASTEAEEGFKDVLSFINKDEIYFDVHLTEGLFDKTSIKVGDTVLTKSGKAAYTGNEEIVFEGKSDQDKDVYLVIISLKAGEKAMSDYSTVEASDLPDMISKRIPIHKSGGKDKILVVVTDTKDGYDHNFSEALSDLIKLAIV